MLANFDLMQQAASGSIAAQMGLIDLAIEAGASGACRQIESLVAAEAWARLASARGGRDENRALVGVLLSRAEFEIGRCAVYNAQWYECEARRVLKLLIALDVDGAQQVLEELGPSPDREHHAPDVLVITNLAAAAQGDLAALSSLYDDAIRRLTSAHCDPVEALTAAELYARLGAALGNADQVRRLAGVLLLRAEYEYQEGRSILADSAVAEGATLLSMLVDTGDASMAHWLSALVNQSLMTAIGLAARFRPTLLKFIEPQGAC